MKRLLLLFTLCACLCSARSFAAGQPIPAAVLVSFQQDFSKAKDISSASVDDMIRISFIENNRQHCAYYRADGELVVVSTQVTINDLPSALRADLQKRFGQYFVADVYQFNKNGKITWYAALNGARQLTLSAEGSKWN